jgi:hypothetical protein
MRDTPWSSNEIVDQGGALSHEKWREFILLSIFIPHQLLEGFFRQFSSPRGRLPSDMAYSINAIAALQQNQGIEMSERCRGCLLMDHRI